jgi:hypothetical protein
MTTEKELRIHLREEFVDSGFIQVFQWRNFEDYFNIELNKAKKEERDKLKTQVLDKIDEMDFSITAHSLGINEIKQEWQDKHNKEVKEIIKEKIKEIFER